MDGARDGVRDRRNYHLFFAFAYFLTMFCHTLSCEVTIAPHDKISVLNGSFVTVTCKATGCDNPIISVHEKKRGMNDYQETEFLDVGHNNTFSEAVTFTRNNGSSIYCYDASSGTNSTPVTILVQDSIDAIAGFRVKKTVDSLKISWFPVFAYGGLRVQYMVSFKGQVKKTSKTRTALNTTGLDECQFANLNITSIINDATNRTLNNTNQWSIPIETPPIINELEYTMMMGKNGSIFLNLTFEFNLSNCICPGRLNGILLTIMSDTHTFDDVLVQSNNCTGFAKLLLPPFANITSIAVKNFVGIIPISIAFDINPLRNISYPSPSSVQCIFTDSIMTINNYSTGCLYYDKMGEPVYIPRENYESNVTTRISSNGQTCFFPLPLPVNQRCQNISIDISATQTEKNISSTAHHESTSTVISTTSSSLPSWPHENYALIFVSGLAAALLGSCIGTVVVLLLLFWVLKYCFKCKSVTLHLEYKDTNTAPIGAPIPAPVPAPIPAPVPVPIPALVPAPKIPTPIPASPNTNGTLVLSRTIPSQDQGFDPTSNYVSAGSFSLISGSGVAQHDDRMAPPENAHGSIIQNLSNQFDSQL